MFYIFFVNATALQDTNVMYLFNLLLIYLLGYLYVYLVCITNLCEIKRKRWRMIVLRKTCISDFDHMRGH